MLRAIGQVRTCDRHGLLNQLCCATLWCSISSPAPEFKLFGRTTRFVQGRDRSYYDFCCVCGGRHDLSDKEACAGASEARQTRSVSKMSKGASKDNISDLKESVCSLTLQERKPETLCQIEEPRLENELA